MISRENFRFAAAFAALSGVLHIAAPVVSGFASEAWLVVPFGVIYLILAYGLFMGWRWLAWLAFFWSFAGVAGAISKIWTQGVLAIRQPSLGQRRMIRRSVMCHLTMISRMAMSRTIRR